MVIFSISRFGTSIFVPSFHQWIALRIARTISYYIQAELETARERWNFILQRGGSPIFWGSKWPRSLSSSGRSTFEIASRDNETTCKQPARAPTPSANTGNLCKRLNAIVPTIEKHHEPRSSSTHFTPRPPFGSWFFHCSFSYASSSSF